MDAQLSVRGDSGPLRVTVCVCPVSRVPYYGGDHIRAVVWSLIRAKSQDCCEPVLRCVLWRRSSPSWAAPRASHRTPHVMAFPTGYYRRPGSTYRCVSRPDSPGMASTAALKLTASMAVSLLLCMPELLVLPRSATDTVMAMPRCRPPTSRERCPLAASLLLATVLISPSASRSTWSTCWSTAMCNTFFRFWSSKPSRSALSGHATTTPTSKSRRTARNRRSQIVAICRVELLTQTLERGDALVASVHVQRSC